MTSENSNISCDVCMDLIPLVKDHVASDDSVKLVYDHIQVCEDCKRIFHEDQTDETVNYQLVDQKIIFKVKRSLFLMGMALLVCGTILGVFLSNTQGMFYNFILMPVIGCLSYLILKKKWIYGPFGVFLASYSWILLQMIFEGNILEEGGLLILSAPLILTGIYTILTLIGAVIGALLKFALRKEEKL